MFNFDGIALYQGMAKDFGYVRNAEEDWVHDGQWRSKAFHFASPFEAALCLIHAVAVQTLRAIASILSAIMTIDPVRCVKGFLDLVSAFIQLIALPIVGIGAIFSPRIALMFTDDFRALDGRSDEEWNSCNISESAAKGCCNALNRQTTGIIRGLFGVPIGLLDGAIFILHGILAVNTEQIKFGSVTVLSGVVAPALGSISCCSDYAYEKVNALHSIALKA